MKRNITHIESPSFSFANIKRPADVITIARRHLNYCFSEAKKIDDDAKRILIDGTFFEGINDEILGKMSNEEICKMISLKLFCDDISGHFTRKEMFEIMRSLVSYIERYTKNNMFVNSQAILDQNQTKSQMCKSLKELGKKFSEFSNYDIENMKEAIQYGKPLPVPETWNV